MNNACVSYFVMGKMLSLQKWVPRLVWASMSCLIMWICYGHVMTSIVIIFLCECLVSYGNDKTKNDEC